MTPRGRRKRWRYTPAVGMSVKVTQDEEGGTNPLLGSAKGMRKMNARQFAEQLRQGQRLYGTLVVSTSPRWLKYIGRAGIDFVFIDTEHVVIDRETLSWMCYAYQGFGLPPLVRIPAPDPYQAAQVLDGGAWGVIAPYVETPEQAAKLRGAVKLRPLKGKKLRAVLSKEVELEPELQAYLDETNRDNLLILNIESRPALESLDEILEVPGIDAVLIGPHDLSCSLGIPEQYDHPDFDSAVRQIIRRARAHGVAAGIHYSYGVKQEIQWAREEGLSLIIHSHDLNMFVTGMKQDLSRLREALGDITGSEKHGEIDI